MTAAVVLAAALLAPPARAAHPAAEALALVPPDPAIVLVVRDARAHLGRVAASPFAAWVRESPAGKAALHSPDLAGLAAAEAFVAGVLGVSPRTLLDDVFGDAVVLTYTPATAGGPDVGVAYVRPRNPATLRAVLKKLDAHETATGEVTAVETRSHAGHAYTARLKDGGGDFVAERAGVFAYSSHEPAVRDFLARPRAGHHAARLQALGADGAFLAAVFRLRAFDRDVAAKVAAAKDPRELAFLQQFQKAWAAADAVAVTAHPAAGLEVAVSAAGRPADLPPELRRLAVLAGPGAHQAVPADALLAVRARVDVPALLAAAGSFLSADGRAALAKWVADTVGPAVGRDHLSAVLAGFGPEVGLTVEPPPAGGGWAPAWTAAVRLPDPTTHPAVAQAADTVARFARFQYNRTHADQVTLSPRGAVTAAAGPGLPAGVSPSYGVVNGHLVAASTPARAAAVAAGPTAGPPLVRVSAKALGDYLRTHRAKLVPYIAATDKKPPATVRTELDELAAVLSPFDALELHAAVAPGRVRVVLRVGFVKPLER